MEARKRYEKSKKLLSGALTIEKRIRHQKAELRTVEEKLLNAKETERQTEVRIRTLQPLLNDYNVKVQCLSRDRGQFEALRAHVEGKEAELATRERHLEEKEARLKNVEKRVRVVESENESLQRVIGPLRSLIETVNPGRARDLSPDAVVIHATKLADELHSTSDTFVSNHDELNRAKSSIREREGSLSERERRLSMREDALALKESELHSELDRLRALKRETKQLMEDARVRADSSFRKETSITARENELLQRESKIGAHRGRIEQAEQVLQSLERSLKLREQSLQRKEATIEARERAVDAKDSELMRKESEISLQEQELRMKMDLVTAREAELGTRERALARKESSVSNGTRYTGVFSSQSPDNNLLQLQTELSGLRTQLVQRENILTNRERALSRREDAITEQEALLRSERNTIANSRAERREKEILGSLHDKHATFHPDTGTDSLTGGPDAGIAAEGSELLKDRQDGQAVPSTAGLKEKSTVRKRLAFATPKLGGGYEKRSERAMVEEKDADEEDDSSVKAAEELLSELIAVRGMWIERVDRLYGVAQQMLKTTTGIPAIRDVCSELLALKRSIEQTPAPGGQDPVTSFEDERQRHIEWGGRLRRQHAAIEHAQTNLLLNEGKQEEENAKTRNAKNSGSNGQSDVDEESSLGGSSRDEGNDTEFRIFRSDLGDARDEDAAIELDRILARARK